MVQGKFGDVEEGVENNLNGIKELNKNLDDKTENIKQQLKFIESVNENVNYFFLNKSNTLRKNIIIYINFYFVKKKIF